MADGREENDQVSGRVREELCLPCTRKDKKTIATVFCYDCDNFQCKQCADAHNVFDVVKGHKMANAGEITTKPVKFDMEGLDQCETHGKLFEFLCYDHGKLCCSSCAIIDHRACHDVLEIKNVADASEDRSMEIRSRMVAGKELCDSAVTHWKSTDILLRDNVKGLPEKINNIRAEMNNKFDDLLQEVKEDSTTIMKLQSDKRKKNISRCEGLAQRFQTSFKFLDKVSTHGTAVQKFIAEHVITQQVKVNEKEVQHECDQLETADISIKLNETLTLKDILEGKDRLGSLKTETNKVTIDHVRGDRPVKLKLINSVDIKQSDDDKKEPVLAGIEFLPDGRLVAVDLINYKLLVFNDCLDKTVSYSLSYRPLSIVAEFEDTIAITSVKGSNTKIEFLQVSKSNEITTIKSYKVNGKYNSICVKDDDHFVVGTFDDVRLARILSMSGQMKDFSINFHSKNYQVHNVSCTYIKERDKVIISDRNENTVNIYDVKTNTRVDVKDSRIQGPIGVDVGPMNCVFVCSALTDSIVQISATGEILSSHQLDMKFPIQVCVSKDETTLAVSNNCLGYKKLQIFKIN